MKVRRLKLAFVVLLFATAVGMLAMAETKTLTGVVTDDMCGNKHTMMPGKPDADCIRACIRAGSKYALLVGDKVYTLKGDAKQFDRLAGKKVKVSGDLNGTAVAVSSVAEVK